MNHHHNTITTLPPTSRTALSFLRPLLVRVGLPAILIAGLAGCGPKKPAGGAPPMGPLPVKVSQPVEAEVQEYQEFTGRFASVETVDLRARVSGYLDEIHFKPGATVKKGDLLFTIDQRPYRAALASAEAEVERSEAALGLAKADFARAKRLVDTKAISAEEFDKAASSLKQAQANLHAAQAARDTTKLDLEYTEIRAPISGRITREQVTVGNLVQGGAGNAQVLASIFTIDPIYVYFDADENAVLRYRKQALAWTASTNDGETQFKVQIGVGQGSDYPFSGNIDYIENRLDPATGTERARVLVSNPDQLIAPGMFARVRAAAKPAAKGLLVSDRVINFDQGNPFVYVITADNKAVHRPIETGPLQDGLRIVRAGLKPGERIAVDNLLKIRPGAPVAPTEVPMPRPASPADAALASLSVK